MTCSVLSSPLSRATSSLNLRSQATSRIVNLQLLRFCPEKPRNEPGFMPKVPGMCRLRTPQVSPKLPLSQRARQLLFYVWLSVCLTGQMPLAIQLQPLTVVSPKLLAQPATCLTQ